MASFQKTASGKVRVQIDKNGVRDAATFNTKGEARAWAIEKEAAIAHVAKGGYHKVTFGEALDRYAREVSPTKRGYMNEVKRIEAFKREFPEICRMLMSEITTEHMVPYRDKRLKVVTKGTVQRDINMLSNVFTIARKEWRYCGASPFTNLRAPGQNPPRERRITMSEVRRMLRQLNYPATGTGQPIKTRYAEIALAFLLGFRTGMRAGEIISLNDDNVEFMLDEWGDEVAVVTAAHKMQYATGRPRKIPITVKGAILLRRLSGRGRYFTLSPDVLDVCFRKARIEAGLEGFTFHDSRAEGLTRLAPDVDVMTLARISGHKNLQTLYDHYYRESAADIAKRLSAASRRRTARLAPGPSGAASATAQ